MNPVTLLMIMRLKNLNQSDLAKKTGLSRQAISLWFKKNQTHSINIHSKHLQILCNNLNLKMDWMMQSMPLIQNEEVKKKLEATFLWDRLFPNLEDFAIALVHKDWRAVARLVQIEGLFKTSNALGKDVWKKFHFYKKWMLPVRAKECERIWNLQKNLKLI